MFVCTDPLTLSGSFANNIMCAAARIKLMACNLKRIKSLSGIIDDLSNPNPRSLLEKKWKRLPGNLKTLLSNKELFGNVTVKDLDSLNQDLLSSLKSVGGMTDTQFKGMMSRLEDFNPDNLNSLFDKVNVSIIYANISGLGAMYWNKLQLKVMTATVYKRFGMRAENWTSIQLGKLGTIVAALPTKDLSRISPRVFNDNLEKLCGVDFSIEQKLGLLKPAYILFGDVDNWSAQVIERMCQFVSGLSAESIKYINSSEIARAVGSLQKHIVRKDVRSVVLRKIKEAWGEVSKWNTEQVSNIGTLVNEMDASDIEEMQPDQLIQYFKQVSMPLLDKVQMAALYDKVRATFRNDWPDEILQGRGNFLEKLSLIDLEHMTENSIMPFLEKTKFVEWSLEQADFLLRRVQQFRRFPTLSKNDIRNMNSVVKAFLTSDVARLSRRELYNSFPLFGYSMGIGEPVIRYFIKIYKMESRYGEIKSLGRFATALTRYDLEREVIRDILANLDALKYFYFKQAPTLELLQKVFIKIGRIDTRKEVMDNAAGSWESVTTIKQMMALHRALSRRQLVSYPLHALASVIEVFGQTDTWKRRQILGIITSMKRYWYEHNMKISDLTELDIEALGQFVQGFTVQELERIPGEAKVVALRKLGQYTGLPADKLKARAQFAFEFMKNISGGVFNSRGLKVMGNLVAGLTVEQLKEINPDFLLSNLFAFVDVKEMPTQNLRVIFDIVKKTTGTNLTTWSADQWRKIGRAIQTLNPDEIKSIRIDAFKLVIDVFGSLKNLSDNQINALFPKIKLAFGDDVSQWTDETFRKLGSLINRLNPNDVAKINEEVIRNLASYFGNTSSVVQFQQAFAKRFIEVVLKNNMTNLNTTMVKRLGKILLGFTDNELKKIRITSADILSELGKNDWSSPQIKILVDKALAYIASSPLDTELYYYLGNIAKGLTPENIRAMPNESFRLAAGMFGKLRGLTEEQRRAFAAKAKKAWGNDVSQWTAAMVSEAGQFMDGLIDYDISTIPPENIARIPSNVIARMGTSKIRSFSRNQILEFTQDQARAVTKEQFASLSPTIVTAVQSVISEVADRSPRDVAALLRAETRKYK